MTRRTVIRLATLLLIVAGVGCSDEIGQARQLGAELIEIAEPLRSDLASQAAPLAGQGGSRAAVDLAPIKTLDFPRLADLYMEKRWVEADDFVANLDDEDMKVAFGTVGDVLLLEEVEGIDGATLEIDAMLADPAIDLTRARTLEIMRSYVNGKNGAKTSDIVVTLAMIGLMCAGTDIDIHGAGAGGQLVMQTLVALAEAQDARIEVTISDEPQPQPAGSAPDGPTRSQ